MLIMSQDGCTLVEASSIHVVQLVRINNSIARPFHVRQKFENNQTFSYEQIGYGIATDKDLVVSEYCTLREAQNAMIGAVGAAGQGNVVNLSEG
jgi:hypothetical protein